RSSGFLVVVFLSLMLVLKAVPPLLLAGWSHFSMEDITVWTRLLKPVNLFMVPAAIILQCAAWMVWFTFSNSAKTGGAIAWSIFALLLTLFPGFGYWIDGSTANFAAPFALGIGEYLIA